MKQKNAIFIVIIINYIAPLYTNTITLFFKPYGAIAKNITPKKLEKFTKQPGALSHYLIKQQMKISITQSICATYMGDFAVSNINGSLSFNRKTIHNIFYILVTPMIKPVIMLGATVHHLTIADKGQYALYKLTYTKNTLADAFYWNVVTEELPENKAIPLNTIIIFARPTVLILPLGASIVQKQLQLIMPDIFVTKNIDRIGNSLRLISIRHLFTPVHLNQKISGKKHDIMMIKE